MSEEEKKTTEAEVQPEEIESVQAEDVETVEKEEEKADEVETLQERIKELEETITRMKEDELRRAADTENYKKRLRADKENAVKYANESLISDLLEPLDNFSRAIDAAESSDDTEAFKKGVIMVKDHLMQILKQNWGLEMIDSVPGKAYDPNTMEAYGVQEKEESGRRRWQWNAQRGGCSTARFSAQRRFS